VNEEALAHWGGCRSKNKQTNSSSKIIIIIISISVKLPSAIIRMSVDYLTMQYQVPNVLSTNSVMGDGNREG
jgi:hypothetical protein